MVLCASYDPGFGNGKGAVIGPGGLLVATVPSVVGVGETDLGMLSLGKLGRRRRREPDRVSFEGITYLVGEGVSRYARPQERMDFQRLSDGPELRALFYATVFRLLGPGCHELALMVGLPVEVMADRKRARETLRAMRKWMVGEHRFTVNDAEASPEVADVKAMAQPAGAFFAWGLDDRGRWVRAKSDLKAPVAICDVGFNTLDLFAVEGGEVVGRFTGGDTAGMRRAAEQLIAQVRGLYGVDLSLHEADALLRQRRPVLYTSEGEVSLQSLVGQALDAAAAGIVTFVERRWGNARQFAHVLFAGGGAEALRGTLESQYPHGVVLTNAVTANAIGLARYAVRAFGG
jgi:hypothetical protein